MRRIQRTSITSIIFMQPFFFFSILWIGSLTTILNSLNNVIANRWLSYNLINNCLQNSLMQQQQETVAFILNKYDNFFSALIQRCRRHLITWSTTTIAKCAPPLSYRIMVYARLDVGYTIHKRISRGRCVDCRT